MRSGRTAANPGGPHLGPKTTIGHPGFGAPAAPPCVSPGSATGGDAGRGSRIVALVAALLIPLPAVAASEAGPPDLRLGSSFLGATVHARGALLTDLRLAGSDRNLLEGAERVPPGAPFGHFLCFDRWGPPSSEDRRAGIPFHGEAGWMDWQWLPAGSTGTGLTGRLPKAGFEVSRRFEAVADRPMIRITTEVRNPSADPRPANLVEHASLAPCWLNPGTRLRTNALRGFLQHNGQPVPDSTFSWPEARYAGRILDLRGRVEVPGNLIASLVCDPAQPWAWAVIENNGELLGYAWRPEDFPWLNLLWQSTGSGPVARAIEPGTTGLHRPLEEVLDEATRLETPLVTFLGPGETRIRRLWVFAVGSAVSDGGLRKVSIRGDEILLEFHPTGSTFGLPLK